MRPILSHTSSRYSRTQPFDLIRLALLGLIVLEQLLIIWRVW